MFSSTAQDLTGAVCGLSLTSRAQGPLGLRFQGGWFSVPRGVGSPEGYRDVGFSLRICCKYPCSIPEKTSNP